jgi:hypothetical protein
MWVKVDDANESNINFSKLLRVRILKKNGSNEIPVINFVKDSEYSIDNSKWYLLKYTFNTSNDVGENMNIYLSYDTQLISSNIYYADLTLVKVLQNVPYFVFTNGLVSFISGFYCDNGSLKWNDVGVLENNFILKNKSVVDTKEGYVNLYNNILQESSATNKPSTFMINLLLSIKDANGDSTSTSVEDEEEVTTSVVTSVENEEVSTSVSTSVTTSVEDEEINFYEEEEEVESFSNNDSKSIIVIKNKNNVPIIELKQTSSKLLTLEYNKNNTLTSSSTSLPIILSNKTLLSIAYNNDVQTLVLYQDCNIILTVNDCDKLYDNKSLENSKVIINESEYVEMHLYDYLMHNYVLLEKEHKELRSYLINNESRMISSNKKSLLDYIFPKNMFSYSNLLNSDDDFTKDPFYRMFQSTETIYKNVKKEKCDKAEVKPTDCPSVYKKGDDYYIYVPKNSFYHNKLGYYGEKLYGNNKDKVKYIYQMNFPDCELPTLLTNNEGGKYSQTCPFIIEENNPCKMVGCGNVNWDTQYVEDLGLNSKCKNAVSYYCRINYDLDPKCAAWKPSNKYDRKSMNIRNYFEMPDEYCDIRNFKIEDHPDFKKYIKKDNIPCWGCKIDK